MLKREASLEVMALADALVIIFMSLVLAFIAPGRPPPSSSPQPGVPAA